MLPVSRTSRIFFCTLLFLSQTHYAVVLERDSIKNIVYTVEPIINNKQTTLQINCQITLKQLPDDEVKQNNEITLPMSTPYKEGPADLTAGFKDFKIISGAREIRDDEKDSFIKYLDGISSDTIVLQYSIVPTIEDITHIDNPALYYKPIITPTFFHATGRGIFIYPDYTTRAKRSIQIPTTIRWHNIPKGWHIANSFGIDQHTQEFNAQGEQLAKGVFVGGDYTVEHFDCLGYPIYIAMRDNWTSITAKTLGDIVIPIVRTQRAFWNDFEYPHFIVTLMQTSQSGIMISGDSATNGIKLYLPANVRINQRLIHLIGHELFHLWNGQAISFAPGAEWFHQGFTDYYADQCALRAGLLSFDDYIAGYNQILFDYYSSPVIDMPHAKTQELCWQNYAIDKLPYQRGYILAHNWNALLKSRSKNIVSMDDIMRELRKQTTLQDTAFSDPLLISLCKQYIPDIDEQIHMHISQGVPIKRLPQAFGNLCTLVEEEKIVPNFGFDINVSVATMIITGVCPAGPAYKAGLRNGDRIVELLSRASQTISDPVILRIKRLKDGAVVKIQYVPTALHTIKVPQYKSIHQTLNS